MARPRLRLARVRKGPTLARRELIALPDDEYLRLIGSAAYKVGYLEWIPLGDLTRLAEHLPKGLTVAALAGKTTGQIASALTKASPSIADEPTRRYLAVAGELLAKASAARNDLLHARPATTDEGQRLDRWKADDHRGPHVAKVITTAWLEELNTNLDGWLTQMFAVRQRLDC